MTIFYEFEGKLYANITNKCPCSCVFCIRKNGDSVADNDSLWLEHEPSYEEIIKAFDNFDKTGLHELVFCGYGEPMERADVLLEVAKYVKQTTDMKIRINTNGLVDFINPAFDSYKMRYIIDCISISLNAPDPESYLEVSRPKFGLPSFNSIRDLIWMRMQTHSLPFKQRCSSSFRKKAVFVRVGKVGVRASMPCMADCCSWAFC